MPFVLDASATLAWHFADESDEATELLAERAFQEGVAVPAHWMVEVANGLVKGERRKRTTAAATAQFVASLAEMKVAIELIDPDHVVGAWTPLARAHRLSVYDAAYLELAERTGLAIATVDAPLANAARRIGVEVLGRLSE